MTSEAGVLGLTSHASVVCGGVETLGWHLTERLHNSNLRSRGTALDLHTKKNLMPAGIPTLDRGFLSLSIRLCSGPEFVR